MTTAVHLSELHPDELEAVAALERRSFTSPWSARSLRDELSRSWARFLVAHVDVDAAAAADPPPTEAAPAATAAADPPPTEAAPAAAADDAPAATAAADPPPTEATPAAAAPPPPARRLAGYLLYWLVHDEAHILTFATEPALRGRGIGSALLDEVVRDARARGVRQVHLEVRRSNEEALRLYRHFGFVQIGVRPKYYQDNREDAVVMMLDLDIVKSTPAPRGVVVVR